MYNDIPHISIIKKYIASNIILEMTISGTTELYTTNIINVMDRKT